MHVGAIFRPAIKENADRVNGSFLLLLSSSFFFFFFLLPFIAFSFRLFATRRIDWAHQATRNDPEGLFVILVIVSLLGVLMTAVGFSGSRGACLLPSLSVYLFLSTEIIPLKIPTELIPRWFAISLFLRHFVAEILRGIRLIYIFWFDMVICSCCINWNGWLSTGNRCRVIATSSVKILGRWLVPIAPERPARINRIAGSVAPSSQDDDDIYRRNFLILSSVFFLFLFIYTYIYIYIYFLQWALAFLANKRWRGNSFRAQRNQSVRLCVCVCVCVCVWRTQTDDANIDSSDIFHQEIIARDCKYITVPVEGSSWSQFSWLIAG